VKHSTYPLFRHRGLLPFFGIGIVFRLRWDGERSLLAKGREQRPDNGLGAAADPTKTAQRAMYEKGVAFSDAQGAEIMDE